MLKRLKNKKSSAEFYIELEKTAGYHKFSKYSHFSTHVNRIRKSLKEHLDYLKELDMKVVGFGASAKGISLMNYCGITDEHIYHIIDETPSKHWKFTPGSRIPIFDYNGFHYDSPDYILILAWNFKKEIIDKTIIHKLRGGKYIIPIPKVEVL